VPQIAGTVRTEVITVQTVVREEDMPQIAAEGLRPQRFVRNASLWPTVEEAACNADAILDLVADRSAHPENPTIEKLWAEAIYEHVRQRLCPKAPSRLDCLFAVEVGDSAIRILPELAKVPVVDAAGSLISALLCHTRGSWIATDMHLFSLPPTLAADRATISTALTSTSEIAEAYWIGRHSKSPVAEFLCEGLERAVEPDPGAPRAHS
jgi:hypothetical protein